MDISKFLRTDEDYEPIDSGRWMPVSEDDPDTQFFVIGMQSKEAQDYLKNAAARLREQNGGKELTSEQINQITQDCLTEVCLKDWKGVKNNGEDLPFSRELARRSMNSRDKTFMVLVSGLVNELDRNAEKYVESVTKK